MTVSVTIYGPNLTAAAQRLGELHVHRADCADGRQYGPGRRYGGDDHGWTVEVASRMDAVLDVYPDGEHEGADVSWLHFAPCLADLPEHVEPVEAAIVVGGVAIDPGTPS